MTVAKWQGGWLWPSYRGFESRRSPQEILWYDRGSVVGMTQMTLSKQVNRTWFFFRSCIRRYSSHQPQAACCFGGWEAHDAFLGV